MTCKIILELKYREDDGKKKLYGKIKWNKHSTKSVSYIVDLNSYEQMETG